MLSGCVVRLQGLVHESRPGAQLEVPDGTRYRLVTVGDAAPLAQLGGHLVHVDGRRIFRTIRVEDWQVPEGVHGMTAWVGELRTLGVQLGIQDRNSGGFYLLDAEAEARLSDDAGKVVLVEGYVVGPHQVKVMYAKVLEPTGLSGGSVGSR